MGDTLLSILLFVISFGLLICIHEAGHLSMAKLFKVYCKEYSIGFGPAIFSRRKEGHETKFSIRCIPLGGYVSMYGEEGEEDPELSNIPKERSLEGVAKWKKAIIVSAGVILNAVLAFIFIAISYFAFPIKSPKTLVSVTPNSVFAEAGIVEDDKIQLKIPDEYIDEEGYAYAYVYSTDDGDIPFFLINEGFEIDSKPYAFTFYFSGDKDLNSFADGLTIYPGIAKEKLLDYPKMHQLYSSWLGKENCPNYFPNVMEKPYELTQNTKFTTPIYFVDKESPVSVTFETEVRNGAYAFKDIGLYLKTIVDPERNSFSSKLDMTFKQYGSSASAVFAGLAHLFTKGPEGLSGFLGIYRMSSTILTNYTFATYLRFWGLISVNLAIFNLLPFPGLDGWQLLVTAVEGISKKKLPDKFKTIMSLIGLALLFGLMIVVFIMDIVAWPKL